MKLNADIDDELMLRLKVYVAGIKGKKIKQVLDAAIREYLDKRRGVA